MTNTLAQYLFAEDLASSQEIQAQEYPFFNDYVTDFVCNSSESISIEKISIPDNILCKAIELDLQGIDLQMDSAEYGTIESYWVVLHLKNSNEVYKYPLESYYESTKYTLVLPFEDIVESVYIHLMNIQFVYDYNQGNSGCIGIKQQYGKTPIIKNYKLIK
ncbi:hypothetical protein [Capnocytophaga catalasegens]|uniref:Uncharacterized protein n=1 Tax=Capnocytophaga catalasegens TaxID=1004260 RepID=A0AAV5AXT2_9FLAO|nr:hypothetical protein [Capnocytophaga catalasegens]GIZ15273.1 hypothetical protein RCZ03_12730 [Capnocytophaga catalasegens]GJM51399.1 hypothetical protein RCZ15_23720 [Capnocytophaga catalasegens]GJM54207.1 hypothetical protein RCZ16_25230 [Capnocytophaga catalasegens]